MENTSGKRTKANNRKYQSVTLAKIKIIDRSLQTALEAASELSWLLPCETLSLLQESLREHVLYDIPVLYSQEKKHCQ